MHDEIRVRVLHGARDLLKDTDPFADRASLPIALTP